MLHSTMIVDDLTLVGIHQSMWNVEPMLFSQDDTVDKAIPLCHSC